MAQKTEVNFVVWIIEMKWPRQRRFYPATHHGVFDTRKLAKRKIAQLIAQQPVPPEYRATGYWDKRPW